MSEWRERASVQTSKRLTTLSVDFIVILPTVGRTDRQTDPLIDMLGRKIFQEKKTNSRNKRIFSFSSPSYFYIALSISQQKYARAIERLNVMYEIIDGQRRQLLDNSNNNNRKIRIFSFSLPVYFRIALSISSLLCQSRIWS